MSKKKKVLILCTSNSCRSQMTEGLVNYELSDSWMAFSAGVEPSYVNPRAVKVMAEIGIDISGSRSKSVEEFLARDDLDLVITVCDHAKETCPAFLQPVAQVHMGFEDPAPYNDGPDEIALSKLREIRDKIRKELLPYLKNRR